MKDIPFPRPGKTAVFFGWTRRYNRRVKRWVQDILDARTGEEVRKAWEETGIDEKIWHEVTEIVKTAGNFPKGEILPDDEAAVFMGGAFLRSMDEMEWESFFIGCERLFQADFLEMPVQILKNGTFREFILAAQTLPKSEPSPRKTPWFGCGILTLWTVCVTAAGISGFSVLQTWEAAAGCAVLAFFAGFILLFVFFETADCIKNLYRYLKGKKR